MLFYKDETISASYEDGNLKYIIVKDNKIIEEYNGIKSSFPKTYNKIFERMKDELTKIKLDYN